jgi:hypothetical protein
LYSLVHIPRFLVNYFWRFLYRYHNHSLIDLVSILMLNHVDYDVMKNNQVWDRDRKSVKLHQLLIIEEMFVLTGCTKTLFLP